jgi:hypothetical protein
MDRTKLSYALFISLLLLLGITAGFWVAGFWSHAPVPVAVPTPGPGGNPQQKLTVKQVFGKPGWCCMTSGLKCVAFSGGANDCLKSHGKMFSVQQTVCDSVCSKLKK